ncbi:hypothetical protein [Hymenobacter sp. PAMC 26628]|uniref:hypothetical protein n=1 Tax=Hymenobacter sp. PAMC 26628 TaxID=1484118 RepID=UPI000770454C|nr:hypothetical protein [Hymenobacter sp. PAMC 26628]AMJ65715.1 hypothetical protein AXW84_09955 [Hymenobacter sp. PAMC 26628]
MPRPALPHRFSFLSPRGAAAQALRWWGPCLLAAAGCAPAQYFQSDARLGAPAETAAGAPARYTAGRQYARPGVLHRVFFGKHHRSTWAAPVAAPVFDVATAAPGGALRRVKLGGGFNSTSLGVVAADGRPYVLRTVDKDPRRALRGWLKNSPLAWYLRDNVSATHPYGALAVPPLARAVGVPHTNPRLFYARPADPALAGDSLAKLRGQLVWLEEKFSADARPTDAVPTATALVGSEAFYKRLFADPRHRPDPAALLRARLLDAWLGDWDRHAGQWTWAQVPTPGAPTGRFFYQPVPKDRDMVFYRAADGVFPWLFTRRFAMRKWNTFRPTYYDLKGLLQQGHYLDEHGLISLTAGQFQAAAAAMQGQLTDAAIDSALHRLPPAAYALEGPYLAGALRQRRADLPHVAAVLYRRLSRRPTVGGTAQAERFVVRRFADSTTVAVYAPALGPDSLLLARTFSARETKVVTLEGLEGADVFEVTEVGSRATRGPHLAIYGNPAARPPAPGRGMRYFTVPRRGAHAYSHPAEE